MSFAEADNKSLQPYNIPGKLLGVGPDILLEIFHEMKDGHDLQQLISSSSAIHNLPSNVRFPWAVAQVIAQSYPLSSFPIDRTELVCFRFQPVFVRLFPHENHRAHFD